MTPYVYGIKTQTGQHIDVSLSEKGAKQYATRHGYIVVTRRDARHYYVTEIAKKNESGGWVAIKGEHLSIIDDLVSNQPKGV